MSFESKSDSELTAYKKFLETKMHHYIEEFKILQNQRVANHPRYRHFLECKLSSDLVNLATSTGPDVAGGADAMTKISVGIVYDSEKDAELIGKNQRYVIPAIRSAELTVEEILLLIQYKGVTSINSQYQ
jgi:hypothetical protein